MQALSDIQGISLLWLFVIAIGAIGVSNYIKHINSD
jgi:hypothetical protein